MVLLCMTKHCNCKCENVILVFFYYCCCSDFFDSGSSMAPNSEEGGRFGCYPFGDDSLEKVIIINVMLQ